MEWTWKSQPSHTVEELERDSDNVVSSCCCGVARLSTACVGQWLLVACLTSQQQASVSQGRICSDNSTCCHTAIEVADPTFYLTQSQYTDTGLTSPSADPITPGAWQGSHWSANFWVTGTTRPRKKSCRRRDSNPGSSALEADALPLCGVGQWRHHLPMVVWRDGIFNLLCQSVTTSSHPTGFVWQGFQQSNSMQA